MIKRINKIYILILLLLTGTNAWSQWECPSKLAAHFDPLFNSPLLAGAELQLSTGLLDGNSISTAMGLFGVDFTKNQHSIYLEGGIKAWWNYDTDNKQLMDQFRPGMRELFYQYKGDLNHLTIGLQSATFDDHFLLNERIMGANYKLDLGKWKFNAYAGTVTKDFARNGIFCTTGFIYGLPTGQDNIILGNSPGDKNLTGYTLTYFPNRAKNTRSPKINEDEFEIYEESEFQEVSEDEFGAINEDEFENADTDEFESFDSSEFSETSGTSVKEKKGGPPQFGIEKIGIAAYSEFGKWIQQTAYYTGLFSSLKLPGDFYLNPEVLMQIEKYNSGIIWLVELDKSITFNNGHRFSATGGYYAFTEIDEGAVVLNSYSNILAGEVLRLDAANMPFYLIGAKYNIPKIKTHIKLQHAGQTNGMDLQEWDTEIGKKFGTSLFINAKAGIIQGGQLDGNVFLGRLEARYYF